MPVLELQCLSVHHSASGSPAKNSVEIVSSLDLCIEKASIFGLAGESGCGKSMTALAVMGILPPNMRATGSVVFEGRELGSLDQEGLRALRGSRLAMIFQEPMTSLNPVLRVGYQIREVIDTHLNISRREAEALTLALLRSVRIPSPEVRVREYPHQLSGGMRQRVMIAMAIACGPSLLIADEPTTALDVTIEAQILELLRELRREKQMAVLLITHDLGIIAENAETVAIMYAGRLVEQAPVVRLFDAPLHPYTVGLLGSLPLGREVELRPIPGTVPRPGNLPAGCKFSDRCAYVIDECREAEPALAGAGNGTAHLTRCLRHAEAPWNR